MYNIVNIYKYICISCAFVGLYNKLHKTHGTYITTITYLCQLLLRHYYQLFFRRSVGQSVSYPFIFKYSSQAFSYGCLFVSKPVVANLVLLVETLQNSLY
jgi:hypothetical protein